MSSALGAALGALGGHKSTPATIALSDVVDEYIVEEKKQVESATEALRKLAIRPGGYGFPPGYYGMPYPSAPTLSSSFIPPTVTWLDINAAVRRHLMPHAAALIPAAIVIDDDDDSPPISNNAAWLRKIIYLMNSS